jgi:methionine-rich copper-binding protein CopC
MMTAFKRLLALISLLTIFLAVQPVQAHGYIVRAIPENRAVLDRAPPRLQYWFSEPLERDFSSLNVRDQNGDVIAVGGVADNDASLMSAQLPPDLPDGAYIVELRPAFASDGHVVAESRVFFVGEEIGGVAGKSAAENPIALEVVWRAITLTAMMVLFGTFTLYANILVPAWGSKTYRAGLLPPRVMRRLNWIIAIALVVLIGGNILALIQQTMTFFGIGFVKALDSNFWSVVRIGSRFGDIWNIRMIFIGIVGMLYLGKGPPGVEGKQGTPGEKGSQGDQGLKGDQGPKGAQGPVDLRGESERAVSSGR